LGIYCFDLRPELFDLDLRIEYGASAVESQLLLRLLLLLDAGTRRSLLMALNT